MKLILFGRETCDVCKNIKEKLEYFSDKYTPIPIEYFDVETVCGLGESAYRNVPDIPTVILMKENDEIKRWVKSAPIFLELKELISNR